MAEFVFVKLCELDEGCIWNTLHINLDFSAAATRVLVDVHVTDQLLDRVCVRSGTNVKDYTVFWPDLWANTLEKPLVTVNFTVVTMFDSKNKIDPVACEHFLG